MRRRIVTAIMTVSAVVMLLFAVPLAFVIDRFLDDRATIDLEHRVDVIARTVDLGSAADPPETTDLPKGTVLFAIYTPEGVRILGNGPDRLETSLRRSTSRGTTTIETGGSLLAAAPVVADEVVTGLVRGQRSLRAVDRDARNAIGALTIGALSVLTIGWILARRLAATLGNATDQLSEAAQQLGSGDFTVEVPSTGIPELDRVAASLNTTARRVGELVTREQTFSADVSHQLRTPITALRTALEAELAYPRVDPSAAVREALADVARLERTVADLLALARSERLPAATFAIRPILEDLRHTWSDRFTGAGRLLTVICPAELTVAGTPALLRQALEALLDNAARHGAGPTRVAAHEAPGYVSISVSDRGAGVKAPSGRPDGMRLGLTLVARLTEAQGGRFLTARPGPNPSFQIMLRRDSLSSTSPSLNDAGP